MRWPHETHPVVVTFGFPADYDVRILPGIPYAGTPYRDVSREPGRMLIRAGLVVKVTPKTGDGWIGNFESGWGHLSGVSHTSNPDRLMVVADGQGYFIAASDPEDVTATEVDNIQNVIAVPEQGLFIFSNDIGLACYTSGGALRWAGRIAADDLEITDVEGTTIRGTGSSGIGNFEFAVDARTGACIYETTIGFEPWWDYPPGRCFPTP